MPLVSRTFDQLIDFTRTTSGTFVGSNGFIQSTPQSRNLLTFTQEFDNAVWVKTELTVSANTSTAPDGTTTADIVIPTTNAAAHFVTLGVNMTAGVTYALSVYAKASGYRWLRLSFAAAAFPANNRAASFDLQTGTVGQVQSGVTATISDAGNGWYRCTIVATATTTAVAANGYTVNDADNASATSFSGNGTGGILLWGAQLETGTTATTYTRNFGGLFPPRFDYDPVTLAPKGLLIEEQRTNLLTYSEQFNNAAWVKGNGTITADAIVSPDGSVNADAFIENTAASAFHYINQSVTKSAVATPFAVSFYVKDKGRQIVINLQSSGSAGVVARINPATGTIESALSAFGTGWTAGTVTITAVSNGFYRVVVTATSDTLTTATLQLSLHNGTTSVYTGDGTSGAYLWGAQLEAGDYATSYIPTVASQVTRTADQAVIAAPNFAPWYNQSEGTFVVEASVLLNTGNRVWMDVGPAGAFGTTAYIVQTSSSVSLAPAAAPVNMLSQVNTTSLSNKAAIGIANNNSVAAVNGILGAVDTSCTMPASATQLTIGGAVWGATGHLNGHIRSIRYYPTRLSNAQLQALTA